MFKQKIPGCKSIAFSVLGMTCSSCASRIEKKILGLDGVVASRVNFSTEMVFVDFDPQKIILKEILETVKQIGFDVLITQKNFPIKNLSCSSCVSKVQDILTKNFGVLNAQVNLALESVRIDYISTISEVNEFKNTLQGIGYDLVVNEDDGEKKIKLNNEIVDDSPLIFKRFVFCAFMTFIFIISGLNFVQSSVKEVDFISHNFLLLLIASPVQFFGGWIFYQRAWAAAKNRYSDMNTLIAVGTSAAYLYSLSVTLYPDFFLDIGQKGLVYFDSSVMIITLVLMGRLIEGKVKTKASNTIYKLISLQPKTARVERDNLEIDISIAEVVKGDIITVKLGEKVPVDGIIVSGYSSVDESMISGESTPIDKNHEDKVIGGSINKTGVFKMRATHLGKNSMLSQIVRLVTEAQGSKASVQRLVDKVSGIFVPVVIVIATLSFLSWYFFGEHAGLPKSSFVFALMIFISVLVIACPCALGLATPTAIMVGTGRGAELGVLIKGGEVLEKVGKLNTIFFDKTGTLTKGTPNVKDIIVNLDFGISEKDLLIYAASLEKESEHPLAQAIVREAKNRDLKTENVQDFKALPGFGVMALLNQQQMIMGNMALMRKNGINIDNWSELIEKLSCEGKTVMILTVSKKIAGLISTSDTIRPYAKETVGRLKKLGLEVAMLTGDNRYAAESIGKELNIRTILSEVLPEDKLNQIKTIQAKGLTVGMVGDGINDAPALAQADLGIAVGSGTDIAMEASDITLITNDLRLVADSIELSNKTIKKVKQNLFWAFFYNCLGIPIAAGALYPTFGILLTPVYAATAMALSSISVISNSLLLKKICFRK